MRWMVLILVNLAIPWVCGLVHADEPERVWTGVDGRTFRGSLVSSTDEVGRIRRADGKMFEISRNKLSKADNDYLAGLATPDAAPAGEAGGGILAGYDPASANFDDEWPKDAGVGTDVEIVVVSEDKEAGKFIYESPHFRFESDVVLRPSLVSKVATMFEACFQAHHVVPLNNRRTRAAKAAKLKARLFETVGQYVKAGGLPGSAGVYRSGPDEFMVPLTSLGVKKVGSGYMFDHDGDFRTMFHEITHQLWADLGMAAGIWMVEGMAEFMSNAPYRSGRFSFVQQPKATIEFACAYGKKGKGGRALGEEFTMPGLEKLMGMSQAEFYQNSNINYAYGLLLTHYFILLDGEGDGARFKECIKKLQEGGSAEDARKVLLAGRSYQELEKDFAAGMRRRGVKVEFR